MAALVAGFAVALAFTGGVRLLTADRGRLQSRLEALSGRAHIPRVERQEQTLLRDRGSRGLLERLLSRGDHGQQTLLRLQRADLPLRPGEYLMVRVLVAALGAGAGLIGAGFAAVGILTGLFVIGGAIAGAMAPPLYVRQRIVRRARLVEFQLVEMTELMASSMAAGFGYMQALVAVAEQMDPPIADEIRRMVDDVNLGGDIDEALEALNDRLQSTDFDIVATAIIIQRTSGGNLGDILRGVARTIRARQSFKREVMALTSRERFSAMIIAGFPLVLVGGLALMVPEIYGRLFTDTIGRIALGAALVLDAVAYFVIQRMTKIEV